MTNFWTLSTGEKPTGSDSASFASNFGHVPDGTQANAVISAFVKSEYDNQIMFQITWKIIDGEFENTMIKQTLTPYSNDEKKADRAKNMFVRLYTLANITPSHAGEPNDNDLVPFLGLKCSIKAGNGIIEEKEKTWIREVHVADKLEVKTGHVNVTVGYPESALTRNAGASIPILNDDIPF